MMAGTCTHTKTYTLLDPWASTVPWTCDVKPSTACNAEKHDHSPMLGLLATHPTRRRSGAVQVGCRPTRFPLTIPAGGGARLLGRGSSNDEGIKHMTDETTRELDDDHDDALPAELADATVTTDPPPDEADLPDSEASS